MNTERYATVRTPVYCESVISKLHLAVGRCSSHLLHKPYSKLVQSQSQEQLWCSLSHSQMLEQYLLLLLSWKSPTLKLQVLHFTMNHSVNITTVTARHKQVYFKMPIATFLLCLAVLQSFLNSCRHTCCWEVREMVLFCPPSPLEAQSIQFTCWKEVRGLSSGHSVRQTNAVISHGQVFLQHNHISMTSHFVHSLYAMHSGKVRGGVWCRETFECSAALAYISAWWHWIAQSPNHRAQHALTPSPPLAHLLSVCAGAL